MADASGSGGGTDPSDATGATSTADPPAGGASHGDQSSRDHSRRDHVIVVGYDVWTEPVLERLQADGTPTAVLTTDAGVADRLRERAFDVVYTEAVDEASFRAADVETAGSVLVATLDDHQNVLSVLTARNVSEDVRIVTFAGEERDVEKLRTAGADAVVSLGQVVGELLVDVALTERSVDDVIEELTSDTSDS